MNLFSRFAVAAFSLVALFAIPTEVAYSADENVHPKKRVFTDIDNWPSTSPGEAKLKGFRPFRAVYDRQYRQASGPDAGALRRDRVIITAESVGWNGDDAISISLIDSADPERSDTNARVLNMLVGQQDMQVLFEIGPIPGSAKNYYIGRVFDDRMSLHMIDTGKAEVTPQLQPIDAPGFGPGNWVMASLAKTTGQKIRLSPYYSPTANPLSASNYGIVTDSRTVQDHAGNNYKALVLETNGFFSMSNPKISQILLQDSPPYYLGTVTRNLDTDELEPYVALRSFQFLYTN